MADLSRAEKLASAKKKLKQFQMKNRESPCESGRSTPSKRNPEDGLEKMFQSENGGSTSTFSFSQSENPSSNISQTGSPILEFDNNSRNVNGNTQPDVINGTLLSNNLPTVSENLFKAPSPRSFFTESPQPVPGADFFDSLSSGNDPPDRVSQVVDMPLSSVTDNHVDASTPDGPYFVDTPNYSFPDVSCSPIRELHNEAARRVESPLPLQQRNPELERQLEDQKQEMVKLQKSLEERASNLKHHVKAIEILVSEKSELQSNLEKEQQRIHSLTGEIEELQGRLRASRHRVSELERDSNTTNNQTHKLESSVRDLTAHQATLLKHTDSLQKQVGDLELEVSDLRNKIHSRDEMINSLRSELKEKDSQLSLAEVRIQQLSGGAQSNGAVEAELRHKIEELSTHITSLESQLTATSVTNDESKREYQHYVDRLLSELQQLRAAHDASNERCGELVTREQQLVQQVNELERQLNRMPEDPALQSLRSQLHQTEEGCQLLQTQLQQKESEVECLREGLQERALRIQELEVTVERLETERPDSINLQAAIESDKVAASRAVAQNTNLKRQVEELQDALVSLSNEKAALTEQLQQEQHRSREVMLRLDTMQVSKAVEVEKAQQTDQPSLQECEVQTSNSVPVVSPEVMTKLEEKFRKTMGELADLSDEKQRLEHLVLQLQSETETIGEYITLYQIQRGMLRQRAQEKDEQVAKLAEDKEALRNKLAQLNCLVQRLVGAGHGAQLPAQDSESESVGQDQSENPVQLALQNTSNDLQTAEKIQSLLTEIGSNNLVTSTMNETTNINFHPCPWCSGRLITV